MSRNRESLVKTILEGRNTRGLKSETEDPSEVPICGVCGEKKPGDVRVQSGMMCERCVEERARWDARSEEQIEAEDETKKMNKENRQ